MVIFVLSVIVFPIALKIKNSFHLLSTYYVAISMLSILQILLTTVLWLMCNYLGQVEPVLFLRSENRSSEGLHNLHKVTQKV